MTPVSNTTRHVSGRPQGTARGQGGNQVADCIRRKTQPCSEVPKPATRSRQETLLRGADSRGSNLNRKHKSHLSCLPGCLPRVRGISQGDQAMRTFHLMIAGEIADTLKCLEFDAIGRARCLSHLAPKVAVKVVENTDAGAKVIWVGLDGRCVKKN